MILNGRFHRITCAAGIISTTTSLPSVIINDTEVDLNSDEALALLVSGDQEIIGHFAQAYNVSDAAIVEALESMEEVSLTSFIDELEE